MGPWGILTLMLILAKSYCGPARKAKPLQTIRNLRGSPLSQPANPPAMNNSKTFVESPARKGVILYPESKHNSIQ